jgi:ADP-ribose pyrophosphatase YjhB (NUDIX family)
MERIGFGVKAIVRKDDRFLVLVKSDGTFDLPGGRVENGETHEAALHREIDEETGLKVEIQGPVEEWSFFKKPNLLIKGISFACTYLEGKVKICDEHSRYFWAGIDCMHQLTFNRDLLGNLK